MIGVEKLDSWAKSGLKLVVFTALAFTPLIFSTKHSFIYTTPKYTLLASLGAVSLPLLVFYLLETRFLVDRKLKIALGVVGGFIAWLFLASIFSPDPATSIWSNFGRHTGFLTYFFCFILFLSALFIYNKETISAPLRALALGGTLAALSVYLGPALLGADFVFLNNSGNGGTIGNTTYAGIFLAYALFSAAILFFRETGKNMKLLWGACAAIILFSPIYIHFKNPYFLGEARAGELAVVAGVLFSLVIYFYFSPKKVYSILAKVALVTIFLAGAYVGVSLQNENSRIYQAFKYRNEGVRFIYWDMAMKGVAQRPFLGFGLDNFSQVRDKHYDPKLLSTEFPKETWVDKPHNALYEIAFSAGIPALALYLLIIGLTLIFLVRRAMVSEKKDKIIASLLFGLLTAHMLQLFLAFDTVSSLQAFFVVLALVYVFCFGQPEATYVKLKNKNFKILATVILAILGVTMFYYFSYKVNKESKMVRELNSLSITQRTARFANAFNFSPAGKFESESQYLDLLVDRYKANWPTLSPEIREGAKKELLALLQYSGNKSDAFPEDLRFALVTAKIANGLYGVSGGKNAELLAIAKKYGLRAINNSPTGELGYKIMIEISLAEANFRAAMEFTDRLIQLSPRVPEYHDIAIFIAKAQKSPRLIEEKTANAQEFIPNYEYGATSK